MRTELCDRFGIQYPIFVFTPSEKVAAAVSKAGGLGVLGCVRFNDADDLETVLQWMDENTDGLPYGVDIVMPAKVPTEGSSVDINKLIPQTHRDFVAKTLTDLGVPPLPDDEERSEGVLGWLHSVARSHVEVALKHPIKLIANALGSPPKDVIDQAHEAGVPVAALAGSAKHAQRHVENGVDIVVAQGHEAGGHTGEIGSMVLWPEIIDGLAALGHGTPVLAAGGIGTGRQVARRWPLVRPACGWVLRSSRRPSTTSATASPAVCRRSRKRCCARIPATRCAAASTRASPHDCSRPAGPKPGTRRMRPSRCRCRCRTSSSARRISG